VPALRFRSANESVYEFEHDDAADDQPEAADDLCFPELARVETWARPKGCEPNEVGREEEEAESSTEKPDQGNDAEKAFRAHAETRHSLSIFSGWSSEYEFHFQDSPMVS
jgi:hypothetical protein